MNVPASVRAVVDANRRGEARGMFSVCSSDRFVLEAAVAEACADGGIVCIESTCNQVNQFGGYTGMTPQAFRDYVDKIATAHGLPTDRLVTGGDHLGPWVWQHEPAAVAMAKARELVDQYVRAGYTKIHVDTSMRCADDPGTGFVDAARATARAVELIEVAERAHRELGTELAAPVYVVGTEVPTPGGERTGDGRPLTSTVADVGATIGEIREGCRRAGLADAWERVVAVVAQPGVEFGDAVVYDYEPGAAQDLALFIDASEHQIVFEAHSTDYQPEASLRGLVRDHFAILKVGPELTFAMREALFALAAIETELAPREASNLRAVVDDVMVDEPRDWQAYYAGEPREVRVARSFSYSDRIRYYWGAPKVRDSVARLLANLSAANIPPTLVSQYLPVQYQALRSGAIGPTPEELLRHRIREVLRRYARACGR